MSRGHREKKQQEKKTPTWLFYSTCERGNYPRAGWKFNHVRVGLLMNNTSSKSSCSTFWYANNHDGLVTIQLSLWRHGENFWACFRYFPLKRIDSTGFIIQLVRFVLWFWNMAKHLKGDKRRSSSFLSVIVKDYESSWFARLYVYLLVRWFFMICCRFCPNKMRPSNNFPEIQF